MKVKLLTIMAGPEGVWQPGVHDFPKKRAEQLIACGSAVRVEKDEPEPEVVEEAVAKEPEVRETATAPAQRRRPRKKVS